MLKQETKDKLSTMNKASATISLMKIYFKDHRISLDEYMEAYRYLQTLPSRHRMFGVTPLMQQVESLFGIDNSG